MELSAGTWVPPLILDEPQDTSDTKPEAPVSNWSPRELKDEDLPSEKQIWFAGSLWKSKVNKAGIECTIDKYCLEKYKHIFMDLSKNEMKWFIDNLQNTPSDQLAREIRVLFDNPDEDDDFNPDNFKAPTPASAPIEEDFSDLPF